MTDTQEVPVVWLIAGGFIDAEVEWTQEVPVPVFGGYGFLFHGGDGDRISAIGPDVYLQAHDWFAYA